MCWRWGHEKEESDFWAGLKMEGGTWLCGRGFIWGRGLNRSEGEWSEEAWLATRCPVKSGLGAGPGIKAEPNGLGAGPG
jgi:hypothetical protein